MSVRRNDEARRSARRRRPPRASADGLQQEQCCKGGLHRPARARVQAEFFQLVGIISDACSATDLMKLEFVLSR